MNNPHCPKVVFIDLDGTIWDCFDISSLTPPFQRVNKDVIVDKFGTKVSLYPGARDFLKWLKEKSFIVAVLSWNMFSIAYSAMKKLSLVRYFDLLYIEHHPHKGYMIMRALREIEEKFGIKVSPYEIVYIDDREIHLSEIKKLIGNVIFIKMWEDSITFSEVKNKIELMLKDCS